MIQRDVTKIKAERERAEEKKSVMKSAHEAGKKKTVFNCLIHGPELHRTDKGTCVECDKDAARLRYHANKIKESRKPNVTWVAGFQV
jgi:hypothetical protein